MTAILRHLLLGLATILIIGGCQNKQRTQLVVEVGSNLAVSGELDKVDLAVTSNAKTQHTPYSLVSDYKLPLFVGVVEAGSAEGIIEIVATGYLNGAPIVNETADLNFVEGQSMLLKLFLAAECRGNPCTDPATTCTTGGICRNKTFTPSDLTPFDPSVLVQPVQPSDASPSVSTGGAFGTLDSGQDAPLGNGGGGGTGGTAGSGGTTNSGGMTASGGTTSGGTTTAGGTAGSGGRSGGASGSGGVPASCAGLTATCGPSSESCCKSLLVPGGTFYRSYDGVDYTDKSYPATVADFYLDKYEITVGRFRQFLNAGMGTQASPPASNAGADLQILGSGWQSTWNTNLPADTASLKAELKCDSTHQTWTDTAGINESQPQNCMDWYIAFAFCAWDGGRLATEAEWNYAASGGSEQRYYPWSSPATSTTIDDSYAVYCGGSCAGTQYVGSKSPKGDGKWGHADLAGNLWEWTLDWYDTYQVPCDNCASITDVTASYKVIRAGCYNNNASYLRSAFRGFYGAPPSYVGGGDAGLGSRCVRTASRQVP
jgi:formylglycine-generating enzyme required for sulfatase activity